MLKSLHLVKFLNNKYFGKNSTMSTIKYIDKREEGRAEKGSVLQKIKISN